MSIRTFIETDFPAVVEIYERSRLDELANESEEFELVPLERDVERLAALRESNIFVYDQDRVLGYGALYGSEIRALFVHPDARGKGIGKALLEHLISLAPEPVSLNVAKTNYIAKDLYSSYGLAVAEEFQTTYSGKPVLANKMVRG